MRRTIIATAVAIAALALPVAAEELHHPLCLHGCPAGAPRSNDLIIHEIYVLSSNDTTKFADWAAYMVTAETIGPTRPRNFQPDPLLAEHETLEEDDYEGAFDALRVHKGHQVPLASFTGTDHWEDTNLLSNITPQQGTLNNGPWRALEGRVRRLAQRPNVAAVFVMTGPLYERNMPPMPNADETHFVPSEYWKVVAITAGNDIRVAAFIFEQETPAGTDPCARRQTVRTVERRSRLNLFHGLSGTQ